jgi:acyl-CoA reductase-like NAD-dependent aldehyde dehydrogenase
MTSPAPRTVAASDVTDKLLRDRPVWGPFIGGAFVDDAAVATIPVLEASTGTRLADLVTADADTVDRAVQDARRAYAETWRDLSPKERGDLLRKVAALIREHADELAELVAREVAAILPFNWPPIHFAKKCAPALAVGNTVVVKPGEQAPLTVLRLVELANQVLPPGVVNAVGGIEAGAALASHPRVERISFTGATATGRKVLRSAAENLTYTTVELGGKNALIVLEDADLDNALDVAIEGMFYNQGEACTSTSRLLVHSSRYDEFAAQFVRRTASLVVGDPLAAETDIGPLVDARQRDRVNGYLEVALSEGGELLYQASLPTDDRLAGGFFVAPAVLGGVTQDMTVAQEEIFGPVASLMRFDTDDEAVRIANATDYGLTAAICTRDEVRAGKLARRLEVGMVFVNNYTRRTFIGSPFGGVKGSGFGREYAPETLHEFVRAKNVRFPSGRGVVPTWPPRQ